MTLFTNVAAFQSQITWLLWISVIAPLVASGLQTSYHHPFLVTGWETWNIHRNISAGGKLWGMRIFTLFFYFPFPLVPAILIHVREKAKARRKELLEEGKKLINSLAFSEINSKVFVECAQIDDYLEEVRKALLTHKRNELYVEAFLQITIQAVMLLLMTTVSPTQKGLEAVFKSDSDVENDGNKLDNTTQYLEILGIKVSNLSELYLFLSILWSFHSIAKGYIKIKVEKKINFLPFVAKAVLRVRALLASTVKIGCFIAFFTPFFGLFNSLSHWKGEQLILNKDAFDKLHDFWNKETLFRANYTATNPTPPHYSNYTVLTLSQAYAVFFAIIILQAFVLLMAKMNRNKQFKDASWMSKLHHLIEAVNIPEPYSDWDEETGSPLEHRERLNGILIEILVASAINFSMNMILLLPVIITSMKSTYHIFTHH